MYGQSVPDQINVAEGSPVTFDSYPKEDGTRKTEYGKFISHIGKGIGFEHVVHYDEGMRSCYSKRILSSQF